MASLLIDTGGVSVYFPARELGDMKRILDSLHPNNLEDSELITKWLDTIDTALEYEEGGVEQGDVLEGVIEETVEARSVDDAIVEVGEA